AELEEELLLLSALLPVRGLDPVAWAAVGRGALAAVRAAGGVEPGHLVGVVVHVSAVAPADEVPTVDVVDVAVPVVVLAVPRDLVLVDPDHVVQVLVPDVDAAVDDCDDDGAARFLPREELAVRALDGDP